MKTFRKGSRLMNIPDYSGSSNTLELNYWLTKHIMIRRLKKDVLHELPPKNRIKMTVEVAPAMKKKLDTLMKLSNELKEKIEKEQGIKLEGHQMVQPGLIDKTEMET